MRGSLAGLVKLSLEDFGATLGFDGANLVPVKSNSPTGLGLSLDTGLLEGGGSLATNPAGTEYRGALSFRLGPVRVDVLGILTVGGLTGFSVAVVLVAHFEPPIEIAFGFTLNAVGGLVAINRVIDRSAFQSQFTAGALDHLMFPADPVAAAPAVLSTMQAVLPARPGGVVVGPMVRLAWGRPESFVTAELAVIVSLPDPVVLLLGRLRVTAPSLRAPVVDLNAELYGEFGRTGARQVSAAQLSARDLRADGRGRGPRSVHRIRRDGDCGRRVSSPIPTVGRPGGHGPARGRSHAARVSVAAADRVLRCRHLEHHSDRGIGPDVVRR